MSEFFLGEIRFFACTYAPKEWAICAGQSLSITQNEGLFSLLGTDYGGDGVQSFNLPDLRGRVPMHRNNDTSIGSTTANGDTGGEETHLLTIGELPGHSHMVTADANDVDTTANSPPGNVPGNASPAPVYSLLGSSGNPVAMHPLMITASGGSQPHENRQPFAVLTACIAVEGIFPSRS